MIKAEIALQMEIIGGLYCFTLPQSFYPNYKKHGITDADMNKYDFEYEVKVISESRITNLSMPKYASLIDRDEFDTCMTVRSTTITKTIDFYYRTSEMQTP